MSMGVWRDSSVAVVITVENMHNYGSTFFAITKMRMLSEIYFEVCFGRLLILVISPKRGCNFHIFTLPEVHKQSGF